jgi:hypothetical protein
LKLKEFVKKACENPIEVSRKGFWKGILLMIVAWQLIAVGISTHALLMNSWLARFVDFSVQMFLSTLVLFLISIIFNGKGWGVKEGYQFLKITRENEVLKDGQVRHLSYAGRIGAIYTRAVCATSGFFLFELARVYIGVIDNSALHGADALVYASMFGWWVEQKVSGEKAYTRFEWIGMAISASAILFAFIYEAIANSPTLAFGGVANGVGSAVMLSTVILITSIVVYHDAVIRIAFHNCLFGFLASSIMVVCAVYISYDGNFSEIINILQALDLTSTVVASVTYALALIGFFKAYKYIKPVLIAMLGNYLGLGTILMMILFHRSDFNVKDIFINILLIIGSVILGIQEWKKETGEKTDKIIR